MGDHLDITTERRIEIQKNVDLLRPVEADGNPDFEMAFENYLNTLSTAERVFAVSRASERSVANTQERLRRSRG